MLKVSSSVGMVRDLMRWLAWRSVLSEIVVVRELVRLVRVLVRNMLVLLS